MNFDFTKIIEVFRITIPIFALIGLGKILSKKSFLTKDNQKFINNLTYFFALPSLIFNELIVQRFENLINIPIIISTYGSVFSVIFLYTLLSFILKIRKGLAAAFTFGTFWANVSYMGFPLAVMAFGEKEGLANAAIVNAFAMPCFVISGITIISLRTHSATNNFWTNVKGAFLNPVVLAALSGLIISFIFSTFNLYERSASFPIWLTSLGNSFRSLLKLIGGMGLPLALLSVGASLSVTALGRNPILLLGTSIGKIILAPGITWCILHFFFPNVESSAFGVAVLLMSTPAAVASYVVSSKLHVEETFVSSHLALSTFLSMITIPIWVYIVL